MKFAALSENYFRPTSLPTNRTTDRQTDRVREVTFIIISIETSSGLQQWFLRRHHHPRGHPQAGGGGEEKAGTRWARQKGEQMSNLWPEGIRMLFSKKLTLPSFPSDRFSVPECCSKRHTAKPKKRFSGKKCFIYCHFVYNVGLPWRLCSSFQLHVSQG